MLRHETNAGSGKPPRVLVVDDEAPLRITLVANLELEGFDVMDADSGQRALDILERESFDLVLSDIRMPKMTGVELFQRIRQRHPELPVVLMTAFALEELAKEAITQGIFTIVSKPFDVSRLVQALVRASNRPAVLVVDGAPDVAKATASQLEASGVRTRTAFSAESALQAVRDSAVDVCILDLAICENGDTRIIAQLHEAEPSLVVIAVSGEDAPELLRKAAAQGAFAFIRKPYESYEMVELVAKARLGGAVERR